MSMRSLFLSLIICGCIGRCLGAAEHELLLTNGDVVRGVIVEETDAVVVLERLIQGKNKSFTAKMTYLRSKIAKIEEVAEAANPVNDYLRKSLAAGPTVEEQWELATWCDQQSMPAEAVKHYGLVLKAKPGHEAALTRLAELSAVEVDGVWMLAEEMEDVAGVETDDDKPDRSRTIAIVKANQAEKRLADVSKKHGELKARLRLLPLEIDQAAVDESNAESLASSLGRRADNARTNADNLLRTINSYQKDGYDDSARRLRDDRNAYLADITRYEKEQRTALTTQAEATKKLAKLKKEFSEGTVTFPKLEAELKQCETDAVAARAERDTANAAAGK